MNMWICDSGGFNWRAGVVIRLINFKIAHPGIIVSGSENRLSHGLGSQCVRHWFTITREIRSGNNQAADKTRSFRSKRNRFFFYHEILYSSSARNTMNGILLCIMTNVPTVIYSVAGEK